MNIHEYQAKQLFKEFGIAVPEGYVAHSVEEAKLACQKLSSTQWVVKAQIHAGARGKAGGVRVVSNLDQVASITDSLLGSRLVTIQTDALGLPVNQVLVEEVSPIVSEFYLGLLVDREQECLVLVASASGGMDIEMVAHQSPEKIEKVCIDPATGLQGFHSRRISEALGLNKEQGIQLFDILKGMEALFLAKDASQIEINPLVIQGNGHLVALDAKINFDDNALSLHPELALLRDVTQEDAKEVQAREFDLNYITLSGNIGCMVNGAGLAMATMDMVKLKGGEPANFLDVGGGTNKEKVKEAFKLILADGTVKAVLVNIFGGIVKCDVIAEGILAAIAEMQLETPVVVRLEGTNADMGRQLLNQSGLKLVAADDLNSAAEQVVALAGGQTA